MSEIVAEFIGVVEDLSEVSQVIGITFIADQG